MAENSSTSASPELLWTASTDLIEGAEITKLMREAGVRDYKELWKWSVEDVGRFWRRIWDRFAVRADGDPTTVLGAWEMPGAKWFPDVSLSFPEHVFAGKDPAAPALHFVSEDSELGAWTWAELEEHTARIRAGLKAMGVTRGDRVAAYLPHVPEAVAGFLATTSLGGVWSCCSPDFGARTVVDRFVQIEPKVLLACPGYRYGGKGFDRREEVRRIADSLSTVEHVVGVSPLGFGREWEEAFPPTQEPINFERVPFDHPLWIVYSSGTTGPPKAIVHGHGGPLLEHLKNWRLQWDVKPGDRILWITTTGWIMWNYLVCALLSPVSIVLFDGSPGYPDIGVVWRLADRVGATVVGAGAAFIHACMKAEVELSAAGGLNCLRAVGVTGSPLAPAGYRWVYDQLGEEIWLVSTSGGTDIAGSFVGGAPSMPVYTGELSARALGVAVEAWDEDGRAVTEEVGELVVTQPMPSMPVRFWDDPGDERYRSSYFSTYAGVWRHGDWIRITERGSAVIYGRSDSTINRGGIRMGTAEIYAAVLSDPAIVDALVVDVPPADGHGEAWMGLFVALEEGVELSDELVARLRRSIREDCSPRHLPDEVIVAPGMPKTLTGKLLEVPVKKLLMGRDPDSVANPDTLSNPEVFAWFVDFAARRTPATRPG